MAAANESQGLKIAVAIFVTFTVLLAVATYFSYTSYAVADAKQADAEKKAGDAQKALRNQMDQSDELRKYIGTKAEESDAIKTEIKNEYTKIDNELKCHVAEDFSAAADYLGTRTFIDRERIGVIGVCGSGGW